MIRKNDTDDWNNKEIEIEKRLRELAYLNSGIKIKLIDERLEKKETEHFYKGGLSQFIKHLDGGKKPAFAEPITVKGNKDNIPIDLALRYNDSYIFYQ